MHVDEIKRKKERKPKEIKTKFRVPYKLTRQDKKM